MARWERMLRYFKYAVLPRMQTVLYGLFCNITSAALSFEASTS